MSKNNPKGAHPVSHYNLRSSAQHKHQESEASPPDSATSSQVPSHSNIQSQATTATQTKHLPPSLTTIKREPVKIEQPQAASSTIITESIIADPASPQSTSQSSVITPSPIQSHTSTPDDTDDDLHMVSVV